MSRSSWLSISVAMALVLALFTFGCRNPMESVDQPAAEKGAKVPPPAAADPGTLIAGRSIPVGRVTVTQDAGHLYVEYSLDGGWRMTESHLAAARTAGDIPQTRSHNPVPGQFSHRMRHDPPAAGYVYTVDLDGLGAVAGDLLYLAAHAEVQKVDAAGAVIQQESAWAAGVQFEGKNWATYFTFLLPSLHLVTYDGNGATSGSVPVDSSLYAQGQSVTVAGNPGSLAKDGYSFAGWNTHADGSGTLYTEGQSFTMHEADVTLYAHWVPAAADVAGYWDVRILLVGQPEMGPMPFCIEQAGTDLRAGFQGFSLSGSITGSNLTLVGDAGNGLIVTFTGTVTGDAIAGEVDAPGMGAGTFSMARSTLPFGHLFIEGSYNGGVPLVLDTQYALGSKGDLVTTSRFSFSVDWEGSYTEFWFACSEMSTGPFTVVEEVPQNQPGLISVMLWRNDTEHHATGGTVNVGYYDGTWLQGDFTLTFSDGTSEITGTFDLHLDGPGSVSLQGSPAMTAWSQLSVASRTELIIGFWDTERNISLWFNVPGVLEAREYILPDAAWLDVMIRCLGQPETILMQNSGGRLNITALSESGIAGEFTATFSEGAEFSGNFDVGFQPSP